MTENWRPVAGWELEYEVSDHGNVRSIQRVSPRASGGTLSVRARQLKLRLCPGRYPVVTFCRGRKFKITPSVHRLVAIAFIPNPANKPFVNHIDSNRLNNHVSNLEWCTHAENMAHMSKSGRTGKPQLGRFGVYSTRPSLTEDAVRAIRLAYKAGGISQRKLAVQFGTNSKTIFSVVKGRTYANVL